MQWLQNAVTSLTNIYLYPILSFPCYTFRDYEDFLQDLEEDPAYRESVNIYKDSAKIKMAVEAGEETDNDEERPQISLQEMLDDLTLSEREDDDDYVDMDDEEDD